MEPPGLEGRRAPCSSTPSTVTPPPSRGATIRDTYNTRIVNIYRYVFV